MRTVLRTKPKITNILVILRERGGVLVERQAAMLSSSMLSRASQCCAGRVSVCYRSVFTGREAGGPEGFPPADVVNGQHGPSGTISKAVHLQGGSGHKETPIGSSTAATPPQRRRVRDCRAPPDYTVSACI